MDNINGVSLKKLIELVLAVLAVVLLLVAGRTKTNLFFIVVCITLVYLSLVVLMACMSRDIGASPAIEGATGVWLTAYSLEMLLTTSSSGADLGAMICTAALGIILLVFLLF